MGSPEPGPSSPGVAVLDLRCADVASRELGSRGAPLALPAVGGAPVIVVDAASPGFRVDLDVSARAHLRQALILYERHERTNGYRLVPALAELARSLRDDKPRPGTTGDDKRARSDSFTDDRPVIDVDLLTYSGVAAVMGGRSVRTVQRLVARGELLSVRVARSPYVRRCDLDTYISNLTPQGAIS